MSNCIEFCGKPKKKNPKPVGVAAEIKPEIPVENMEKKKELKKQEMLNKLKYVEVIVADEKIEHPPRGLDINIDM